MKQNYQIPLHADLMNHPKFLNLCAFHGFTTQDECLLLRAKLENLWLWAVQYFPDGKLKDIDLGTLSAVCGWQHDPQIWFKSLLYSQFIEASEDTITIINWDNYAGKALKKKQQATERKQRSRHQQSEIQNEIIALEYTPPQNSQDEIPQELDEEQVQTMSRGCPRDTSNNTDRLSQQNLAFLLQLVSQTKRTQRKKRSRVKNKRVISSRTPNIHIRKRPKTNPRPLTYSLV
jgi:hypothetical protein